MLEIEKKNGNQISLGNFSLKPMFSVRSRYLYQVVVVVLDFEVIDTQQAKVTQGR